MSRNVVGTPNPVKTFYQLQQEGIDDFGNVLNEVENLLTEASGRGPGDDDTPELLWGEAADVAPDEPLEPAPRVADQEAPEIAGDRQSADQEAPELIAADTPQPRFARVAARVFARAIDRQPLPPKSPRENPLSHSLRAREAEPAPDTPNPHTSMPHRDGPFQAPSPPTQGFTRPVPVSASARPPARPPPATLESKAAALMRAAARRRR